MTTPDYVDLPADGRSKYPALLATMREEGVTEKWAIVRTFDKVPSARDTTRRLKGAYPDFEFTSRQHDDGSGSVYARYVG